MYIAWRMKINDFNESEISFGNHHNTSGEYDRLIMEIQTGGVPVSNKFICLSPLEATQENCCKIKIVNNYHRNIASQASSKLGYADKPKLLLVPNNYKVDNMLEQTCNPKCIYYLRATNHTRIKLQFLGDPCPTLANGVIQDSWSDSGMIDY